MQNFRYNYIESIKNESLNIICIILIIIGLCGTFNNDTSDDFTTFSGIIESSAQLFAQSWSMGSCTPITGCINTDNGKDGSSTI